MQIFKLFISTLLCVFFLDMIWLAVIAKNIYATNIGLLLRKSDGVMTPSWPAAVIVYLAIVIGIMSFVLPKSGGDYMAALLWGALFGAVTYGIYDFTNFSILANWPLKITLIDFLWGIVLCSMTSFFAAYMQKWLNT
jgi:uncharacterized membrane protein